MDIFLLVLILAIPAIAQLKITTTYNRFKKVENEQGLTGQEVARKILDKHGLENVYVVEVAGNLTDHYDPIRKVVRLSRDVFNGESVSAVGIAAHECGHAIQDKEGYFFMKLRSAIVPVVKLGTSLSYIIIVIGLIAQALNIIYAGIALTALGLIFQLITLPVEFDASKRGKENLKKMGLVSKVEYDDVKEVLQAAAMTYVAGVLASALQILRLVLIFGGGRRD
jgi:hypothetical protein